MASQLSSNPISNHDLEDYLREKSDFAFELKVLQILTSSGYTCEHSGLYEDPITKKRRQFDIRAQSPDGDRQYLLSVECKNIRENFPLIAHCTERAKDESFHDLVASLGPNRTVTYQSSSTVFGASGKCRRIRNSFYKPGDFVARSLDQVGRAAHDNHIINSDSDVYEKLSQAIHSAFGLLARAHCNRNRVVSCILPIVVVPKDRLWRVCYDSSGSQVGQVIQVNRVSLFLAHEWTIRSRAPEDQTYALSHLEIVTEDFLRQFAEDLKSEQSNTWKTVFPQLNAEQLLLTKTYNV